ncbi:MAG TPA: sigma-54 dependent transcriptional regulator [Myxococcaceae bacterium]|nr:sigma-54 dependent transcriptional regulator [Myxococcaceae bacterium]
MRGEALVVDDERDSAERIAAGLARLGFRVAIESHAEEAFSLLLRSDFDVVLADVVMSGMSGLELCDRVMANRPDVPVVLVTDHATVDAAIAALRAGAWDFVIKPLELESLATVLDRAVRHHLVRNEVKRLRREPHKAPVGDEVIGESAALRQVYELIAQVADSDAPVLITGESGTGKELAARELHRRGRRAQGPFVAVNCAGMPEPLLEAELFGQARRAAPEASAHPGLFQRAEGGSLLLEEIGELPPALQSKLLRALQERRVRAVGSETDVAFNARLIAATHHDVQELVRTGRFREDLFYRLNVIALELPPLRARGKDVLLLAQRMIEQVAARTGKEVVGLTPAAAERLLTYDWPGNIRELRNCIERAVALTTFDQITVEDLPERIRSYRSWQMLTSRAGRGELVPIAELERRYILHVLEVVGGSRTLAARTLGMDRKTLYRRLEQYGVHSDHPRRETAHE